MKKPIARKNFRNSRFDDYSLSQTVAMIGYLSNKLTFEQATRLSHMSGDVFYKQLQKIKKLSVKAYKDEAKLCKWDG